MDIPASQESLVIQYSINTHPRNCNHFVCWQNSSKPTNIGTLKILPTDVKSYTAKIEL